MRKDEGEVGGGRRLNSPTLEEWLSGISLEGWRELRAFVKAMSSTHDRPTDKEFADRIHQLRPYVSRKLRKPLQTIYGDGWEDDQQLVREIIRTANVVIGNWEGLQATGRRASKETVTVLCTPAVAVSFMPRVLKRLVHESKWPE